MQNFHQYIENKQATLLAHQIANTMVERNIDPEIYLFNYMRQDPILEAVLIQENIFRRGWDALKKWGTEFKQTAGSAFNAAKDAFAGPKVKVDQAIQALNDAINALAKNPEVSQMTTSNKTTSLVDFLKGIKDSLDAEKNYIPTLQSQYGQSYQQNQPATNQPAQPSGPQQLTLFDKDE